MSTNITVKEFQMWLSGVEEMQPEDWSPDKRQWERIREKINQLDTEPPHVPQHQSVPIMASQPREYVESTPYMSYGGSGLASVPTPARPNNPLFANSDNPSSMVRTPNLDTSDGNYRTAFE